MSGDANLDAKEHSSFSYYCALKCFSRFFIVDVAALSFLPLSPTLFHKDLCIGTCLHLPSFASLQPRITHPIEHGFAQIDDS